MQTLKIIHALAMLMLFVVIVLAERRSKFERAKSHVNVGTIGQLGHGKTTLTAAITSVLAKTYGGDIYSVDQIDEAETDAALGAGMIRATHVDYETKTRHYRQVDCATNADYMKGMIAGDIHMDGAILVVAATDGIMEETRKQVRLCQQIDVPSIVVFLNKCDLVGDKELLELIEDEVRELLTQYGFPGDDIPIIRGSALKALQGDEASSKQILHLAEAMDEFIPEPVHAIDKPFLMPVEDVFTISGRGTVVTGYVESGVIKTGDTIEIVGIKDTKKVVCTGVEMFRKLLDEGRAGDNAGVLLRGIKLEDVARGQVLAKPGSIKPYTRFESEVYVFRKNEGGRPLLFVNGNRPQFYFRTTDITGTIELPDSVKIIDEGETNTIVVNLIEPVAMNRGLRFKIREGGRTVGAGIVTRIIE